MAARGAGGAAGKQPIIGFGRGPTTMTSSWTAAFVERLRELGWIEGRTVAIEYRWAEGRDERFAEIAASSSGSRSMLLLRSTGPVLAAKQATAIPIVFAMAADPVGTGLVAKFARPGGNITGLSIQRTDTVGKRLELLREVSPVFAGWRSWPMSNPAARLEMGEAQAAARAIGLEAITLEIRRADDIAPAFEAFKRPVQRYMLYPSRS